MTENKYDNNPLDDSGIKNEQAIDICNFVIQKNWEKVCGENTKKNLTTEELSKIIETTMSAWYFAIDVVQYSNMGGPNELEEYDEENGEQ